MSGVARGSEQRGGFVPDNVPERGEWFWVDVPEIAAACGLPRNTPLIEVWSLPCSTNALGLLYLRHG